MGRAGPCAAGIEFAQSGWVKMAEEDRKEPSAGREMVIGRWPEPEQVVRVSERAGEHGCSGLGEWWQESAAGYSAVGNGSGLENQPGQGGRMVGVGGCRRKCELGYQLGWHRAPNMRWELGGWSVVWVEKYGKTR